MSRIRIGTRGSALALWQAEHVKARLEGLGHEVELRVITTTGDRLLDRRLESVGGNPGWYATADHFTGPLFSQR